MTDEPVDPGDDFEAMLEESFRDQGRKPKPGDQVRATVVQVGRENLLLDLGGGLDGIMDAAELASRDEEAEARAGDEIEAYVLRFQDGVAELGFTMGRGAHGRQQLEEAMAAGLPVQGRVAEVNAGGFVVEVGSTRCFCPMGAMDLRFVDDPSVFVGRSLQFLIMELRGSRDVVLSRRRLLQQERERAAEETREKLAVGARLPGTVVNVRDFGAFVDLGGIEGLIPASELGFGRSRPEEVVETGQALEVEVLRMETDDKGRERITLSLKSLQADPLQELAPELAPGTIALGAVTRLQPFGAFVELVPGVEGLIHVSAFGRRVAHPADAVEVGQDVAVRVESLDVAARRIGLQLVERDPEAPIPAPAASGLRVLRAAEPGAAGSAPGPAEPPGVGAVHEVTVERVARFGVFVTWPGGRGLVPNRELGVARGEDPGRKYPVGTTFQAAVTEVREDGKVTLSKEGAALALEQAEAEAWSRRKSGSEGLGTIGDLFNARRKD